ncbi:hypothetical protein [Chryseobacterium sp. R2A-55]|uniref:hypothetical protein n=1 Tax=Chryseobacterium sp. R2A-55 TaxID=2744445 RepID=UPI001F3FA6A2|nr:hypothetical protein [Chryseobacterium sp. R2A-55]
MMKAISFIFILFFGLLLSSCTRNEEINVKELTDQVQIDNLQKSGIRGIPFPKSSKAMRVKDDVTDIILPDDVFFIAKILSGENAGQVINTSVARVTCSCTKGSGCSPVVYSGNYYCVMNSGCTSCSMSTSANKNNESLQIVGIIDTRNPVKFFAKQESRFTVKEVSVPNQYFISEDFFKNEYVKNEINNIYKFIYGENIPEFIKTNSNEIPDGYGYVKANFFGNEIMFPIEKKNAFMDGIALDFTLASKVSCNCSKGSGCKLGSILGTKYCDAGGCTVCTLIDNAD